MASGKPPRRKVNAKGRNSGDAKHVRLYRWVMESRAYRQASCPARCLLVELMLRYSGRNNGDISMSSREAAGLLNVSRMTAYRAFNELQELGFIRMNQQGIFRRHDRKATTWILTEYGHNGLTATKDFLKPRLASNSNDGPMRGTIGPRCGTVSIYDRAEKPLTVSPEGPKPP